MDGIAVRCSDWPPDVQRVSSILEKKVALRVVPTTAVTNEVCWVDSDRTDDVETRRSVSGGFMTQKEVPVGSWARTQATHLLSSCEAEH